MLCDAPPKRAFHLSVKELSLPIKDWLKTVISISFTVLKIHVFKVSRLIFCGRPCDIKGCVTRHQKELFHLSVKELSLPIKDPLEFFQYLLPFSKYTCSKLDGF